MQKTIYKCYHGSHLYGTNNADSDIDYFEIFLPSKQDILLGNTKSRQQDIKNKIDTKRVSIHTYLEDLANGVLDTVEVFWAPDDKIILKTELWDKIKNNTKIINHDKVISKLEHYITSLYNKNKLYDIYYFRTILNEYSPHTRLYSPIIQKLFEENKIPVKSIGNNTYYEICGKLYGTHLTLQKFCKSIDARTNKVAQLTKKEEQRLEILKIMLKQYKYNNKFEFPIEIPNEPLPNIQNRYYTIFNFEDKSNPDVESLICEIHEDIVLNRV